MEFMKLINLSLQILSSDHLPVAFEIFLSKVERNNDKSTFCYKKADWNKFREYMNVNTILQANLSQINSTAEIDRMIETFSQNLMNARNVSVPRVKPKFNLLEIPADLQLKIRLRNTRRRQWQRSRSRYLKLIVNNLSHDIQNELNSLRNERWNNLLHTFDHGSKKFWTFTKLIRNKQRYIPPLKINDMILQTDQEKAEAIAEKFAVSHSISQNLSDLETINEVNDANDLFNEQNGVNFDTGTFTKPSEIIRIIKNFKNSKAPGKDEITNVLLKHLPKKAIVQLTYLFNACIKLSYFPSSWKNASIIPIPKPNKDHSNPANYRPISLLSCLSKIFERIILIRLNKHIRENEIIPNTQFGFRAQHSTSHQLLRITNNIKSNYSNKKSTGMVLMDIEKAFDSVWHKGLLFKLIKCNFPGYLTLLIKSFLEDRKFQVHLRMAVSQSFQIPAGVPQGSVLSPTLYNIFTSDIINLPECNIAMFADDTAIFTSSTDPEIIQDNLNSSLDLILQYYKKWKIKINVSKTQAIYFTKRRARRFLPNMDLIVDNNSIPWSNEVKYLGIVLDKKLTFKNHIDETTHKAEKYIKILYSFINRKSKLSLENKLLLYKVVFRAILLYGCAVWWKCAKTHKKKIQIIQNKCLKLIHNLPFFYSTTNLHNLDGIEKKLQTDSMVHFNFPTIL